MKEGVRIRRLSIAMKVISIYYFAFIPWIILIAINSPLISKGSFIANIFRFQPFNKPYEAMIASIYIAWAIILWKASAKPSKHIAFIDFTILGNAFYGVAMIIVTSVYKGVPSLVLVESLPWFLIVFALLWLRPRANPSEIYKKISVEKISNK